MVQERLEPNKPPADADPEDRPRERAPDEPLYRRVRLFALDRPVRKVLRHEIQITSSNSVPPRTDGLSHRRDIFPSRIETDITQASGASVQGPTGSHRERTARTLTANLLASPCSRSGSPHELILRRGRSSAAGGLNFELERARHAWIMCVH